MSAFGYKQTLCPYLANVRFTPESGHSNAQERLGFKKQTLDVRLSPNSGRKSVRRWESAIDPTETLDFKRGILIDHEHAQYCGLLGNTEESTLPDTFSWLHGEASIDDFLADPIVQLLMQSDRVSEGELRALLRTASEKLTRAPE